MSGDGEAPPLELPSARFCPYVQRARIALEEKCPGKFAMANAIERRPPNVFVEAPLVFKKIPRPGCQSFLMGGAAPRW